MGGRLGYFEAKTGWNEKHRLGNISLAVIGDLMADRAGYEATSLLVGKKSIPSVCSPDRGDLLLDAAGAARLPPEEAIERLVSDEEAAALLASFGPDDCFGLAFSLVHLIETAPNSPPIHTRPEERDNEWIRRLWNRAVNGGSWPGPRAKIF